MGKLAGLTWYKPWRWLHELRMRRFREGGIITVQAFRSDGTEIDLTKSIAERRKN